MRSNFFTLLLVLLASAFVVLNQQVLAQTQDDTTNVIVGDTMYVGWAKTGFTPRDNALRNAIAGDTLANGVRANLNRVYKLKKGGFYWTSDDITNSGFTLRIVADKSTGEFDYPPVIQMRDTRESDGSTAALHILTASDNVELRNLYISGRTTSTGSQTSYQPIIFGGSNKTYIIDGCIFEHSNFALVVFTGANNNCIITNNIFRNLQETPVTQQWTGRGISVWADQQSVIIENNTFFNVGFATFQVEGGSAKYLRYNHNTIVNTGRGINSNSGNWWQEAYFTNNLIINGWWEGERYADIHQSGRDPRQVHNGLFNIANLPSSYGPEASRRIVVAKNAAYLDPAILAKYGSPDTIVRVWFMDPVSKLDHAIPYAVGGANDGHIYVADTMWLTSLPTGFTNYLNDADWQKPRYNVTGATMVDSMWKFITNIYTGVTGGTTIFYRPTVNPADQTWPLPENFSYNDPSLVGTDGLPLGDLNWFPAQKVQFEANKTTYVSQIEALAGEKIIFENKAEAELEDGTLGGTATIKDFVGFTYFQMDGGGNFQWNFDMPSAGQVDLNVWTHMRGNDTRGQRTIINGTSIHDAAWNWGELIYSNAANGPNGPNPHAGMPLNEWTWVKWSADMIIPAEQSALTLNAGANTLRIESSWGYQNFAGVDILQAGTSTVLKSLRIPNVTSYELVQIQAEGAAWVPNKFKSVALGSNGNVTINLNAPEAGNYRLQVFYQNYSGAKTGQLQIDGGTAMNLPFANDADSTGLNVLSGKFALTAGSHAFKITGSDVQVDYVKLYKETVITSVDGREVTPYTFALEQNYPNPFNPSTTINFSLAKPSNVKLDVFNVLGQKVATLINNQHMAAGPQSFQFNASRLASGVYFYRLEAGSFVSTKKMLLMK